MTHNELNCQVSLFQILSAVLLANIICIGLQLLFIETQCILLWTGQAFPFNFCIFPKVGEHERTVEDHRPSRTPNNW